MCTNDTKIRTLTRDEISQLGSLTDTAGLCATLGISERFARKLCENGKVKARKIGKSWRISTASIIELAGLE